LKLITSPAAFAFRRTPIKTGAARAVERKLRRERLFWSAPAERSGDGALDLVD